MTKKDIEDMTLDVMNDEEIPKEIQEEIYQTMLATFRLEKYKSQAHFTMFVASHDEDRMLACKKDTKRFREYIEFIQNKLNELGV